MVAKIDKNLNLCKSLEVKVKEIPQPQIWSCGNFYVFEDYLTFDYLPRNDLIRYFQGKRFASRGACSCRRRSSCRNTPATSR